jgi:hypothetical protein
MSVDISKYMDVSSERRSPVWNHMLLYKDKGDALCKLCLDKKVTKTVYAKNGSTKTILDHLRLIHGIGKNASLVLIKLQNALKSIQPSSVEPERCFSTCGFYGTKVRSNLSDEILSNLLFLNRHFKKLSKSDLKSEKKT